MAGKTPAAMPTRHAHPMSKCCDGSLPIGGNDLEQIGAPRKSHCVEGHH